MVENLNMVQKWMEKTSQYYTNRRKNHGEKQQQIYHTATLWQKSAVFSFMIF